MKKSIVLFLFGVALVLVGCGPSDDRSVKAREPEAAKVTTRWKWTPDSALGVPKGLIIDQTGDTVEVSFVHLKDVAGFVVDKKISRGRYFAADRQIIIPPTQMTSQQIELAIQMDVPRVEVPFTPEAQVLKGRWVGKGGPNFEMDFVRVQD